MIPVILVMAMEVAAALLAIILVVVVEVKVTARTKQEQNTMCTRRVLAWLEPIPSGHPNAIPTTLDI